MYKVTTKAPVYVEEAPPIRDSVGAGIRSKPTPEASVVISPPTYINSFKEQSGGM